MVPGSYVARKDVRQALPVWAYLDLKAGGSQVCKNLSEREIADALGLSVRTVQRHIDQLEALGLIETVRAGAGHGTAHYRIINPARGDSSVTVSEGVNVTPEVSAVSPYEPLGASPATPVLESKEESYGESPRDVRGTTFRCWYKDCPHEGGEWMSIPRSAGRAMRHLRMCAYHAEEARQDGLAEDLTAG